MELRILQLLIFITRQILGLNAKADVILERTVQIMSDQDQINADAATIETAVAAIKAEVDALQAAQNAGQPVDFTQLNGALADLASITPAASAPAAPADPSVTQPADPNTPAA
jgi:hypothetical protein